MEPGFFFAMLFAFIGAIVLVRSITEVAKRAIDFRERKLELELGAQGARAAPSADARDMARLEERLRVLERIATDDNRPLAQQIERLRELDAVDATLPGREVLS